MLVTSVEHNGMLLVCGVLGRRGKRVPVGGPRYLCLYLCLCLRLFFSFLSLVNTMKFLIKNVEEAT